MPPLPDGDHEHGPASRPQASSPSPRQPDHATARSAPDEPTDPGARARQLVQALPAPTSANAVALIDADLLDEFELPAVLRRPAAQSQPAPLRERLRLVAAFATQTAAAAADAMPSMLMPQPPQLSPHPAADAMRALSAAVLPQPSH